MTQPTNPRLRRIGNDIKTILIVMVLGVVLAFLPVVFPARLLNGLSGKQMTWQPDFYYFEGYHAQSSPVTVAVSPQEDRIVFTGPGVGQQDLYALDLNTRRVTCLARTANCEKYPSFSQDGRSVIYSASVPGDWADHIFVRSLQTGQEKQLTADSYFDAVPSFSPDGSRIVFARANRYYWGGLSGEGWSDWGIYVMNADGSQEQQITPSDASSIILPRFASDNKTIVSAPTLAIMGTHQSRQTVCDKLACGDCSAVEETADPRIVLALSGRTIYFLSYDGGHSVTGLWRVDADGQNLMQIADGDLFKSPLTWTPRI